MRIFLASHRSSFALVIIETAGFLNDTFSGIQQTGLPLDLIIDCSCDCLERVQVLDLRTCSELCVLRTHQRDVDIATQRTLLHLTVTYTGILQQQADFFNKRLCLFRRGDIRLCYNFNQRNTATVIVCQRNAIEIIVHQLSGVLFQMDVVDTNILLTIRGIDGYFALQTQRIIEFRNLICFRKIRIEVILSVERRELANIAAQRHTCLYSIFYGFLVDYRKCAGHTGADRTAAGIGASAELCAASTKNLGLCQKLRMDFQTNNRNIR